MKTIKRILWTASIAALMTACSQPTNEMQSTVVNEDGTVTFRYQNNHAEEVFVDVQFAGKHKMNRDSITGLWTVTLGPAAPDLYPYHYEVDGVNVMDPMCDEYFPNEGFKNSLLNIPSPQGVLVHDAQEVPHGCMEYVHYYSESLGGTNTAVVYLPPSYNTDVDKKYPVFYLISGTTDTEEVYYKVGKINYIADNLIAAGKAKEMIVVLPYGNPNKLLPVQPNQGMPMTNFGQDVFSNDLVNDLMPFIESSYRTLNDRESRAIGGFSRGGNQGLSNGLHNLDKFAYLCSYSSFTSTQIPNVYDNATQTNQQIRLLWTGVGTDDFLYGTARDYTEFLDQKGITCIKEYTDDKFGHTWMNARYFLDKTLPLLFNPEAAETAMSEATPTKSEKGDEQPFTPGVMARLFPKPIISPEYNGSDVTFRMKAPNASTVTLEYELSDKPLTMEKDSDGVWSIVLPNVADQIFCYHFNVDGTQVCDPQNMYLAPEKGFKRSIAYGMQNKYYMFTSPRMKHGTVCYHYAEGTAKYTHPDAPEDAPTITLVIGKNDTAESWMKVGNANGMADRLIEQGQCKPCRIVVAKEAGEGICLKADDFSNWPQRIEALEKALLAL